MDRIDAHNHFWEYDPVRDTWITDHMRVIRHDFLPADLQPLLRENNIDGCIAVQSSQCAYETEFLCKLAAENQFIKGVVGWVDLCNENILEELERYSGKSVIKGFRHILQGEKDRAFMLRKDFQRGIQALQQQGYSYDVLIHTDQLYFTLQFCAQFDQQNMVIDHLAKPAIRKQGLNNWKNALKEFAPMEHVYAKISGLVTEAAWNNWKAEEIHPYLDVAVEVFGTKRLMFGSDWPVCLLAGKYSQVVELAEQYFSSFSETEKGDIFGGNAITFYKL